MTRSRSEPRGASIPVVGYLLAVLITSGCASTVGLFSPAEPAAGEPWKISSDAYPSQRLYRVKYRGPEGDVGFKLTLYLETGSKYRMLASDLGRKLWSLSVDGAGEAVWLDHRRKEYCRASAARELRFLPLADLPLLSLPKLLLGYMPAEPAADLARGEHNVSFLDARGFRWNGKVDDRQYLLWWSLVEDGKATVWWRREEAGGVFFDQRSNQEVSWRQVVQETLGGPLEDVEIPARFERAVCDGTANADR